MPASTPTLQLYRSLTAGYEFTQLNGTIFERRIVLDEGQTRILERGEWTVIALTKEQIRQGKDRADATAPDNATLYYWRALDACAWNAQRSTFKVQPPEEEAERQLALAQERVQAITANRQREYEALAAAIRTPQALPSRVPELPTRRSE